MQIYQKFKSQFRFASLKYKTTSNKTLTARLFGSYWRKNYWPLSLFASLWNLLEEMSFLGD